MLKVSLMVTSVGLQLQIQDKYVVMDNEILQVTLSKPEGFVTGIRYKGIDNLLEESIEENDRGYWDLVWNHPGKQIKKTKGNLDKIPATNFTVIEKSEEKLEISFSRIWDNSLKMVPLNIDKRFVMLRATSGYYTYAIYERLKGWPSSEIDNIRMVLKLNQEKFHYMAISDDRQRYMPVMQDRFPNQSQALDYPEAIILTNPIEPEFKGEVDDKYQYSLENKDIKVHGWVATNPGIGFWQITPSFEDRSAGPLKQSLNSHMGPTNLAIFHSTHYSGADLIMRFEKGEPWKKVFGPVFIYLNSFPKGADVLGNLWKDAKNQLEIEAEGWPYGFVASEDFPPSDQRGSITGRLLVRDWFVSKEDMPAKGAYVGLASPGEAGSWQNETKDYQFWTRTDEDGNFSIDNIRTGVYNLYAFVPGLVGDYKYDEIINITKGIQNKLDGLVYKPPRNGPTLWEIGIPDRTAAEYFIPDPNPKYVNKLYVNNTNNRYRQYGLWERYTELYPREDVIYNVGVDDYKKVWFFAQVTRKNVNSSSYEGTTWRINFSLDNITNNGTYTLQIALATANGAELQVRVNSNVSTTPLFTSGPIGRDNTIARHGIHGMYRFYSVDVGSSLLSKGNNTIFLTQPLCLNQFQGIMYDYIRLEGVSK